MKPWSFLLAWSVVHGVLFAEIQLAPLFQAGAVLQRDKEIPVWGRSNPGAEVKFAFGGVSKSAVADQSGRWMVRLEAMPASVENRTMSISATGEKTVEIPNIQVGEVWLGSGQSNMQWSIAQSRKEDQAEAAKGPVPLLRLFDVPRVLSHQRQEQVKAKWTAATPETATSFSAVGYFFGRELARELNVPIGIIHSSWGGSRIEPWWAEEGLEGIPELAATRTQRLERSPGFAPYHEKLRRYIGEVRGWSDAAQAALDAGAEPPMVPPAPELLKLGHNAETGTYQAMIHPLVPYALRGFLWYQGESNNGEGLAYTTKKQALIGGWRKQFGAPEAPFLFVQLAPFNYGPQRTQDLPGIWWAQQQTLKIPHTGMAVTNDIGNVRDIHPGNKSEVARRLSLWALADTYGKSGVVKSGPLFAAHEANGGSITVRFQHTGGGLVTRDGKEPDWFEVAGVDGKFTPAKAVISADAKSVQVSSPEVAAPERVRFAWSQVAEPNLMNREGLPAGAFTSHFEQP